MNKLDISGINHITLAVSSINKSVDFYQNVLGFKLLVKWHKGAYFLVGDLWFCLNQVDNADVTASATHYAFSISEDDLKHIEENISGYGFNIYKENNSPGRSIYFLDPDGYKLELHSNNCLDRIKSKKLDPGSWEDVVWYN